MSPTKRVGLPREKAQPKSSQGVSPHRKKLESHPVVQQIRKLRSPILLKFIEMEAAKRREVVKLDRIRKWVERAKRSRIEAKRLLATAVAHHFFKEVPKDPRFAYTLAEAYKPVVTCMLNEVSDVEFPSFSVSSYIFKRTHYDNFDNGHFFRRS